MNARTDRNTGRSGATSRRRFIGAGVGAGFSAAFLAACSSSNNNNNNTVKAPASANPPVAGASSSATRAATAAAGTRAATAAAGPVGSPAAAAGPQPKRGGKLLISYTSGEHANHEVMLDAAGSLNGGGSGICYSQLMKRKYGADINPAVQIIPEGDLATKWEQPDPQTYNFTIRQDAKWQNIAPVSGRAVTADDIIYSTNRQISLKVNASYWPGLQSVASPDKNTVQIKIGKPDADFLVAATAYFNKVVAKEAVDVHGDLKDGPVIGSGPWMFVSWTPNSVESMVRNPDYYAKAPDGKPFPYADAIDVYHILDVSTYRAAFTTGRLDYIPVNDKPAVGPLQQALPKLQLKQWQIVGPLGGRTATIRADIAPTNDVRVRQALNQAIDRDGLLSVLNIIAPWFGGSMIAASDLNMLLPEAEVKQFIPFDPKNAKQLLTAAGAADWKPVISTYIGPAGKDTGEFIQANLKQVGLDATIDTMDNPGLTKWFGARDRQFVPFIRGTSIAGVNADITTAYKTDGARNMGHISDPELDSLIDQQAAVLNDANKRNDLLRQIQRKILGGYAMAELYSLKPVEAYSPRLHDVWSEVSPGAVDPYNFIYMWLDQA